MSRLSAIYDDANGDGVLDRDENGVPTEIVDAAYKYLGAGGQLPSPFGRGAGGEGGGMIVEEDFVDAETKLTYLNEAGTNVTGLDRFGRVVDQLWLDYGANPDVPADRYTYTYDRAGNRTSRDNELHAAFDEDYTYDAVNRLTLSERADDYDQSWGLDGLGNMSTVTKTGSTTQTRDVNAANEITSTTGIVTPVYDHAGNMIKSPRPLGEGQGEGQHYKYDAWNRLVMVQADDAENPGEPGDVVATYEYDGANRRIEKIVEGDPSNTTTDFYYNNKWQMVETVTTSGANTAWDQYVYSPRYIDSPIVRFHDGNLDGDSEPDAQDDPDDTIRYYLKGIKGSGVFVLTE